MFHRTVIALACGASAIGLSASAEAAHFSFDFTAPVRFYYQNWDTGETEWYAGDTATGSGFLDADDNGDGSFSITHVSGNVFPWSGSDPWRISYSGGGSFDSSVVPTINLVDGVYQLDNLGLSYDGPYSSNFLILFRDSDGSLGGYGMDGGQVTDATFNLAPAAAVPEVATWGMMVLGFGAMGAAMRRRRTTVSFA